MYENKFHWARKIGLGFRPENIIPVDINQWNNEQLKSNNQDIGLNGIGEWPDDFNFSLEERLNDFINLSPKKKNMRVKKLVLMKKSN